MPHNYNSKRLRDRALFEHWEKRDDGAFTRYGVTRDAVKGTQQAIRGTIVLPGDPDYNKDRVLFNPVFDPYPSMIIYCVTESDIAQALALANLARTMGGAPLTVRSGGHCTAGFSAGYGVLIDLSEFNGVTVDPNAMSATVQSGCNFGDFRSALKPYGLHVPGGECDDVCIGGYVQGGGYGFTSVTFGMNCDNVTGMRVMLYDGSIVIASSSTNADLFWAMRGGTGGTFGILLSVTYQLVQLGNVFGWAIGWPMTTPTDIQNAANALMFLQQNYMGAATNLAQNIQVTMCWQPSLQPNQPTNPMSPYLLVRGCWTSDSTSGNAAIQPLVGLPGAVLQWTDTDSFDVMNDKLLNYPYGLPDINIPPMPNEDKASRYVSRYMTSNEWTGLLQYFVDSPNQYSYFYMEFYGGQINAQATDFNAFVHRTALYNAVLDVFWYTSDQRDAVESFLDGWVTYMEPIYNGEVYQNYPRMNDTNYNSMYWASNQAGVYAVKCKYDPGAVFTFPQVVQPLMPPGFGPGPVIVLPPALQAALSQPIVYASTQTRFRQ
jgi:FAD binding domain